ncbi:MAG: riboflavin synthase [Bacteroidia bacterium]|nr:riboflavin synthase [Bacteroidota bacterium]MBP9081944.1 riboflavin synthase [Bacteroidia bacterium]
MFTGIIEGMGKVIALDPEQDNLHITISCDFTSELKIDQSVAHNGVCLTVVGIDGNTFRVTAIAETLRKTNLGLLQAGDLVNLERSMQMNGRVDGHLVQGHVDETAVCTAIENQNGSWLFRFQYDPSETAITVAKGSICVNGVSLTVVDSHEDAFSVAIIPYTFDHTNFNRFKVGSVVNLEFDIIGKYVARYMSLQKG